MKIGVLGAGSVGSYYGALLEKAGLDTTFIVQEDRLNDLHKHGITVKDKNEKFKVHVKAKTINECDIKCDVILVCVKGYHLDKALNDIENIVHEKTLIISLLNGIESENIIAKKFGYERVVSAVVYDNFYMEDKNIVKRNSDGLIYFGAIEQINLDSVKEITDYLSKAIIELKYSENIKHQLWKKMLINATFNSLSCIMYCSPQDLLVIPEVKEFAYITMEEIIKCASQEGITIETGTIDKIIKNMEKSSSPIKPSMLSDRENNCCLEYELLNGAVIRIAKKHGISVPANEYLYATLKMISIQLKS